MYIKRLTGALWAADAGQEDNLWAVSGQVSAFLVCTHGLAIHTETACTVSNHPHFSLCVFHTLMDALLPHMGVLV